MSSTKHRQAKNAEQHAKREQLTEELAQVPLLGEIVSFTTPKNRGMKNKHSDVVAALKASGLDENVARKFLPAQAFNRACNKLKEERVIDVVRNDRDEILFQFSKRTVKEDEEEGGQEYEYRKEVKVILDKNNGNLTCKDPMVLEQAKKELDRCFEERNTGDINRMVAQLFQQNADLIPVADGTFFVPHEYEPFSAKVSGFMQLLSRNLVRFPIPKGTAVGDKSVQESVSNYLDGLVSELEGAIDEFSLTTRNSTVEATATKINLAKAKVESYALYVGDLQKELLEKVDRANARLMAKVEGLNEERKNLPPEERGGIQARIFQVLNTTTPKTMKQIMKEASLENSHYGLCNALVKDGKLVKEGRGYRLPDNPHENKGESFNGASEEKVEANEMNGTSHPSTHSSTTEVSEETVAGMAVG